MQFREVEPVIKSTFFEICVNRAATNVDLCLPGKLYDAKTGTFFIAQFFHFIIPKL